VSFGERLSTRLLAGYLRRLGVPATQFDAWRLGLVTSDEFTDAQVSCASGGFCASRVRRLGVFPSLSVVA
jgi:aspartokinase